MAGTQGGYCRGVTSKVTGQDHIQRDDGTRKHPPGVTPDYRRTAAHSHPGEIEPVRVPVGALFPRLRLLRIPVDASWRSLAEGSAKHPLIH